MQRDDHNVGERSQHSTLPRGLCSGGGGEAIQGGWGGGLPLLHMDELLCFPLLIKILHTMQIGLHRICNCGFVHNSPGAQSRTLSFGDPPPWVGYIVAHCVLGGGGGCSRGGPKIAPFEFFSAMRINVSREGFSEQFLHSSCNVQSWTKLEVHGLVRAGLPAQQF